jgi:putative redox protein
MVRVELEGGMRFVGRGEDGHEVAMDASAKGGGAESAARPVDVLLDALGGCTGMDVIAILRKMRTEPSRFAVEVEGERSEEGARPFRRIHITYVVGGDVPKPNVRKAIDLSLGKYCPIASTLSGVAEITSEIRFEPA